MTVTAETTRLDHWREPEALANEGCAGVLELVDAALEDAIEMLTYHGHTQATSELRQCRGRVREERDGFLERAAEARAASAER